MKSDTSGACSASGLFSGQDDSSKLMSLLALAAGAIAMPQTSNADVIVTDLGVNFVTVGTNANTSFLIDNLPGTARLAFDFHPGPGGNSNVVSAGQKSGYVRLKTNAASYVVLAAAGKTWDQIPGTVSINGLVAKFTLPSNAVPTDFIHLYLAFKFRDSTQVPPNDRYGWIDLSLSNPGTGPGPNVTIFGYAYENSGEKVPMGAVPEPASATLLALGALTLGARGLRSWRRNRAAAGKN